MTEAIIMAGAIISLPETDIRCPNCGHLFTYDTYGKKLEKSKTTVIYKICYCKKKVGISAAMNGDSVIWLKEDEKR